MQTPEGFRYVDCGLVGQGLVRMDLADAAAYAPRAFWSDVGAPVAGARGRGKGVTTFELDSPKGPVGVVARDYRRGGALGWLLATRFFDRHRAERELVVLAELARRGVQVVTPVAAMSRRGWYGLARLRLLTELVPGALPLPSFVQAEPARRRLAVRTAGNVVGAALSAGLIHPDLHPDNLIARGVGADAVDVRLLDLDRARLVPEVSPADRDGMLMRMARYLVRHAGRVRASQTDRLRFLRGAGFSRAARRDLLERLEPAFGRMLARHGLRGGVVRARA